MSTLIRETENERLYWFKEEDQYIGETRYIKTRTYRLTPDPTTRSGFRWVRFKDQWYKIEPEEPEEEEVYWEIDFDFRPEKKSP